MYFECCVQKGLECKAYFCYWFYDSFHLFDARFSHTFIYLDVNLCKIIEFWSLFMSLLLFFVHWKHERERFSSVYSIFDRTRMSLLDLFVQTDI